MAAARLLEIGEAVAANDGELLVGAHADLAQQIIGKHEQVQDEVAVPGIPSVASHTFKA